MALTGRVNGALFAAAPGPGCPGPTRTHSSRQRLGEIETGRDKRWRETDRAVDGQRHLEAERETEMEKERWERPARETHK